ncbi:MAG TPA: PAS domain-containing protein [Candidatus Eisenbacteria bacterium]
MARPTPPAPDPDRLFELFESMIAADTVEGLLAECARQMGALTEAHASAIFVTDGASVVHEAWQPEDDERRGRYRPHFLGLTHQSVQVGQPVTLPFPPGTSAGLTPHVFLLQTGGRTLGAVCCACPPGSRGEEARRHGLMDRVVRLLAQRVAALLDLASWRATRARYERWFRQLDNHIRVLDRERQKFAAVVNQHDVCVFVADGTRTIRWANRAVSARFPLEGGATWVGKCCRDLCTHFAQVECDGTCPVSSAIETNQVAHEEFREASDDGARSLYATALPIKGPEGRAQEVIVMLQDLSELDTVRRSEARYRALFEERRRAEEALSHIEARLRTVIASSPIVLFSVNREGVFTLSEGRGLEILGLRPGQAVGQSVYEIYRDVPAVCENVRRALAGEEFNAMVEVGGLMFDTHYAPLRDESGAVTGILGVATDVTGARREARAA